MQLALFGFPSVEDIVRKVVSLFFSALSHALLPDFLRNGTVDAIKWLIAVPNPANAALWPNVGRLEADFAALAWGLLGLTLVMGAVRSTLGGIDGTHPIVALGHTILAAASITAYHWAFANAVAFVNVLTHQVLTWPVVADGLARTIKVLFGGSLLFGAGSVFLAVLALVAILVAVTLFVMKVAVLMLSAILYVTGPVVIALQPFAPAAHVTRMWSRAALMVALVPLGWCVIFATAGAISLDVTSFSSLGTQGTASVVGAKTVGAFAGLLMFWFAATWPFSLTRHLGAIGQVGPVGGAGGGGVRTQRLPGNARVQAAQARMRAGAMAGGAVLGRAAGAARFPRGGLAGAATRRTRTFVDRSPRVAAARAATAAAAAPVLAPARRAGARLAATRAGSAIAGRAKAAAAVLRYGPAEMRRAAADAVKPPRRTFTTGDPRARGRAREGAPNSSPPPSPRSSGSRRKPRPAGRSGAGPAPDAARPRSQPTAPPRPRPHAPRIPPPPISDPRRPDPTPRPADNPSRHLPRRPANPQPPAPRDEQ